MHLKNIIIKSKILQKQVKGAGKNPPWNKPWSEMTPEEKAIVEKKWIDDIQRLNRQQNAAERILNEGGEVI